jgi:hypothetical protein
MISREKIQFYRDVLTKDGAGGNTVSEVLVWAPPSAEVRPINMSSNLIASNPSMKTLYEVSCRYNPEIEILEGDKIKWRGFVMIALKPIPDRVNRKMKITAYAETNTTAR